MNAKFPGCGHYYCVLAAGCAALLFCAALPLDRPAAVLVGSLSEAIRVPFAVLSAATEPVLALPILAGVHATIALAPGRVGLSRLSPITRPCLVSAILALGLTLLLKVAIGSARPQIGAEWDPFLFAPFAGTHPHDSLPSAQAATIAALCLCFASHVPASRRVVLPLAIMVSLSRVIVERHWTSDVLAGWVVGGLAATASVFISRCLADTPDR